MGKRHITPIMEFKISVYAVNSELNIKEGPGINQGRTTQAEGTVRAKSKTQKAGREGAGNKSIWNLQNEIKSRARKDEAGEVGKDLSDLHSRLYLIL